MRIRVSSWLVTMLVAASAIGLWTAPAARAEAPGVAPWEAQNPVKLDIKAMNPKNVLRG